MTNKATNAAAFREAIFRHNPVLAGGLILAPVIGGAVSVDSGLVMAAVFTIITIPAVILGRFVSQKIFYAIRICIYAVISAALYIPAALVAAENFPLAVSEAGLYLPLLLCNPIVFTKTETRLYHRNFSGMVTETLGFVVGFDVICVTFGFLRGLIGSSRIGWSAVNWDFIVPILGTTTGGFILAGFLAALWRLLTVNSE